MKENLQRLCDHQEIRDTIIRFAISLDLKDWEQCRSCFADEIYTDSSDLRRDAPSPVSADDFIAQRRKALRRLKTQHLSTNHLITIHEDHATCMSSMAIYRYRSSGAEEITFKTHCYYTHELARTPQGWKICKVQQKVLWNESDSKIPASVSRR
jgi:3-phenylpropionate/cinnamic acid dioxygenase small subunit